MIETIDRLDIPEGFLHRSTLLERPGWTRALIDELLADVAQKVQLPAGFCQTSPKIYAETTVQAAEAAHAERFSQARAVQAADAAREAAIMPRRAEGYVRGTDRLWGSKILTDRGWSRTDITRLLGEPDAQIQGMYRNAAFLWAAERVELAEKTDEKLAAKIEKKHNTAAAAAASAVETAQAVGYAVWRKHDGEWLLEGFGLEPGTQVTVKKANGTTSSVWVGSIVSTSDDGLVLARKKKTPRARRVSVDVVMVKQDTPARPVEGPVDSWGRPLRPNGRCQGNPCVCQGMQLWDDCIA